MSEGTTNLLTGPERLVAAREVVGRFSKYAAVGGLIPLPVVDVAAVAAVQLKMLEQLSSVYGVSFKENLVKELIGTIVGVGASYNFGSAALMAFNQYIRFVPVAGQIFGLAIIPAFAAGATSALGHLFIHHFESGGEFLDLDVAEAKKAFKSDFARRGNPPARGPAAAAIITP